MVDDQLDANNDGLADSISQSPLSPPDTDGDGVLDLLDLDSDNDGIPDVIEAGGTDVNGDGRVDDFEDADLDGLADSLGATELEDSDTDGDGLPDRIDLDSDNDGVSDLEESGGVDSDSDQLVDDFTDTNGDGFDDSLAGLPLALGDSDGDGAPDVLDNDGVTVEPTGGVAQGLRTGLSGSFLGCTLSTTGADPLLPLILLIAMCGLLYSRRAH